ncbi:MAG: YjbH domain-containing protein [Chlamydiales bacterium]|nr:YjbH domain-containing protein [Chlamydiales bacterium]
MLKQYLLYGLFFLCFTIKAFASSPEELASELQKVQIWEKEHSPDFSATSNMYLQTGYINTPSARPFPYGSLGAGASNNFPYKTINIVAQPFSHLQVNGNFRIYQEIPSLDLGSGYGDKSDKGMGLKLLLVDSNDFDAYVPDISVGADDFLGTKAFKSYYGVATKTFLNRKLELSAGYGSGFLKGPFAAIAYSPFQGYLPFLIDQVSFMLEYDPIKNRPSPYSRDLDHPAVRDFIVNSRGTERYDHLNEKLKSKSRFNVGVFTRVGNCLNLSVAWVKGKSVVGQAAFVKDFESIKDLVPRFDRSLPYTAPRNHQNLGSLRKAIDLPYEFNYAFKHQGLQIESVSLLEEEKQLQLTVSNSTYWSQEECKNRIIHLLATLVPKNINSVKVFIYRKGLVSHVFTFYKDSLVSFREKKTSLSEVSLTSSTQDFSPSKHKDSLLYQRKNEPINFILAPDLLTFWGSSRGKVKYALGLKAILEGHFTNRFFYYLETAYDPLSNLHDLSDTDKNNPSQIINVHSDNSNYIKKRHPRVNQLYLQHHFNPFPKNFLRVSGGYFNVGYGGICTEFLHAPVNSNFAWGAEAAVLKKRSYSGLGLRDTVRKLNHFTPTYEKFLGVQAFLDTYLSIPQINSRVKCSFGQFLAKDKGVQLLFSKDFSSGMTISTWLTVTNGKDYINGSRYHDYGFSISIPLEIFSTKNLKSQWNYGMSAWLRDVGYRSSTGLSLYDTVSREQPKS